MAGVNGRSLLLLGACIALAVQCAVGATYEVGGASGWIIPNANTQLYTNWLTGKTFKVGDKLNFTFTTGTHDVTEVTQANYGSCSTTGSLAKYTTGPATVTLNKTGTHYFICGVQGHCSGGQKIQITVAAANGSSPASSPSPSPSTSTSPPPSTSTSPPPSSSTSPSSSPPPTASTPPPAESPTTNGSTPTGNNSSASRLSTSAVTASISILCGAATLFFFFFL